MIRRTVPLLPAINLPETEVFYRKILICHVTNYGHYLSVKFDGVEIHFFLWDDPLNFVPGTVLFFDDNIQDLYIRFTAYGIVEPKRIFTNLWGAKEFQIKDINGNILRFSGPQKK